MAGLGGAWHCYTILISGQFKGTVLSFELQGVGRTVLSYKGSVGQF